MKLKKYIASSLLLLGLLACGEKKTAQDKPVQKILKVSQGAQPKTLDPNLNNEVPALAITKQIYNTLLGVNKDGNLVPELAEKWEFLDDKNLRIEIKKGVKFHNGEPLTVEDVMFSLEKALQSPGSQSIIEKIKSMKKVDENTFDIELSTTFSPILFGLAHPLTGIQNKKYVQEKGDAARLEPMGTGPFKFEKWVPGENIELSAFENYYSGKAKVDKVIFRVIPENTNRLIALETGEIDIAYGIAPIDMEQLEKNERLKSISELGYSTEFIQINNGKAPLNNKKFRQALAAAIDKNSISEAVYLGTAKSAQTIVNPAVFGSDQKIDKYGYNPELSKKLLEESGIKERNLKVWINDNPVRVQVAQIVQSNFKEVGINLEIEILEWGTYLQKSANGEHQLLIGGWNTGTGDADNTLFPLLHSSSLGAKGNRSFYSNKEFDSLIEAAQKTPSQDERKELYSKAQEIIAEDIALIPTVYRRDNIGLQKNIVGFEFKPSGHHYLYNVEM